MLLESVTYYNDGVTQKVIIVDDDSAFVESLKRHLTDAGFVVFGAADGEEGLRLIKMHKPAMILLDLLMPVKDGFAVLKEKHADRDIAPIPVIVVSESNDPKNIDDALSYGVRDYVVKSSLEPRELIEKIRLQLDTTSDGAVSDAGMEKSSSAAVVDLSGYRILWVEDDTYLSDIISRKLAAEKCIFVHAKTGEEALTFAGKDVPDVVMLDILLPGMSGFDVLERMKKDEKLKQVPVILTSNLGQKSDIEKGEKLGAELFLVKATVTLDEIIQEMKKVLARTKKK